jgi:hypothetical protein
MSNTLLRFAKQRHRVTRYLVHLTQRWHGASINYLARQYD